MYGQSVTLTFQVYAPTSGIGTSYLGSVTGTYKQLGDISYTEESHDVGFSVTGWINLVLYGVQITPSKVQQGGNATILGNILNSGNLEAYNANVTVISDALNPTASTSSVFIGEVDPNIPRPFSLLMVFKQTIADGNYSITVKVFAIDNNRPGVPITTQRNFNIQISKTVLTNVNQHPTGTGIIDMIIAVLRNLFNVFFGSSYP